MKVVLTQEVKGLGQAGQVKEVADGYARNYLLPKGLATIATSGAIKEVEQKQVAERKRQDKLDQEMRSFGSKLDGTTVTLRSKVGEGGKLYGSITTSDVAEALERQAGESVDKRKIEIEEPIRHVGEYKIPVRLSRNVTANINLVVQGEEGE
ncbi:MAG TPA: 50S ribosomal protein L9 [Chloroflexota bacterium]